jgi:hypothetical protein
LQAQGGMYGAGIGGGYMNSGGNVTINGGNVTAQGGMYGAGIGGGSFSAQGGSINISGGNVKAIGGDGGAGIGGGMGGGGGNVNISGGMVTAEGGSDGTGIGGGGSDGIGGTVVITGGSVTAKSYGLADIGGRAYESGTLYISGGELELQNKGTNATVTASNCIIHGDGAGDHKGTYGANGKLKEITGFTLAQVEIHTNDNLTELASLRISGKLPTSVAVTDGTTTAQAKITDFTGTFDGTTPNTYTLNVSWEIPAGYADNFNDEMSWGGNLDIKLKVRVRTNPPAIQWPASGSAITYGATLASSTLTDNDDNGSFAWTNGNIIPTVFSGQNGYEITYKPNDDADNKYAYTDLKRTITLTVNPRPLSWNSGGTVESKEYDGNKTTKVSNPPTLNGVINNDIVNVKEGTATYDAATVGTTKATGANYDIEGMAMYMINYIAPTEQPTFTGSITKKQLSWSSGGVVEDKVYDGNNTAMVKSPPVLNGVVGNEDVTAFVSVEFASSAVGSGVNIKDYSLTGTAAGNYSKPTNNPSMTGSITAKPITVTASSHTITIGDALPTPTVSYDAAAFVVGDNIEDLFTDFPEARIIWSNGSYYRAGTYSIGFTGYTLPSHSNYTPRFVNGSLTVNPKPAPEYFRMIVPNFEGVTTNPGAGEHQIKYGDNFSISFAAKDGYSLHGMKFFANSMEHPVTISEDGRTATATIEMPLADMMFKIELQEDMPGAVGTHPTGAHTGAPLQAVTTMGGITVSGLHVGTMLYIYNMTGQLVYSQRVDVVTMFAFSKYDQLFGGFAPPAAEAIPRSGFS